MQDSRSTTRRWVSTASVAGIVAIGVACTLFPEGSRLSGATRLTAWVSAIPFLLVSLGLSAAALRPSPAEREAAGQALRPQILGFAAAHVVHLAVLTSFFVFGTEAPTLFGTLPGGIGYIALVFLIGSVEPWGRRLPGGKHPAAVRQASVDFIGFVFLVAFSTHAARSPLSAVPALAFAGALALRLGTAIAARRACPEPAREG